MHDDIRFIGITSVLGGSGTTSLAVALGRYMSRIACKNVLYISRDFFSGKNVPSGNFTEADMFDCFSSIKNGAAPEHIQEKIITDNYGLKYLVSSDLINPFADRDVDTDIIYPMVKGHCDFLIIDFGASPSLKDLFRCEDVIVNSGFCNRDIKLSEKFYKYLISAASGTEFHIFRGVNDPDSFENGEVDIHGEFGSEVRRLAGELGL